MSRAKLGSLALLSMITFAWGVQADDVGGQGQLFSAAASIQPGAQSAVLAELNEQRVLVVTQFCKTGGDFGPQLSASAFGVIPAGGFNAGACQSYDPGVVLTGGQTVSCAVQFVDEFTTHHCLINGYLRGGR